MLICTECGRICLSYCKFMGGAYGYCLSDAIMVGFVRLILYVRAVIFLSQILLIAHSTMRNSIIKV